MSTATTRKRKRAPPSSVHQSVPPPHLILPTSISAPAAESNETTTATTTTTTTTTTTSTRANTRSNPLGSPTSSSRRANGNAKKADVKNPDDVEIREMDVDDLYHVWRLGESIFDRDKMANLYRTWDPYCVTELYNTDSEFCLVAEVEDSEEIIGFAMGTTISKKSWKYGYLEWLGVAVPWQRFGIARKLFDSFRLLMQNSGAKILIIDTQADNIPALRFFERIGFSNPHSFVYLSKALADDPHANPLPTIANIVPDGNAAAAAPKETDKGKEEEKEEEAEKEREKKEGEAPSKSPKSAKKGRKKKAKSKPKAKAQTLIRNMELADVSKVFHLGEKIFTAKEAQSHYRNWDEFTVVDFFNGDPEYCIVAEVESKVVGFCLGTTIQKTASKVKYGYITWIGVQSNYRRRGIGTHLYLEIIRRMLASEVKALLIDTQNDNKAAISFFEKQGFGNPVKHVYLDLNLKKFEDEQAEAEAKEE